MSSEIKAEMSSEIKYVKPKSFGEAVARVGCAVVGYPLCVVSSALLVVTAVCGFAGAIPGRMVGTLLGHPKAGTAFVGGLAALAPAIATGVILAPGAPLAVYAKGGTEGLDKLKENFKKAKAEAFSTKTPTEAPPRDPAPGGTAV